MKAKAETISMKEAVEITGMSRMTLYRRVEAGKLTNAAKPIPGLERKPVKLLRAEIEKLRAN